jgi:hypothetical protein
MLKVKSYIRNLITSIKIIQIMNQKTYNTVRSKQDNKKAMYFMYKTIKSKSKISFTM